MDKQAYDLGRVQAFEKLGFSEEFIKEAFLGRALGMAGRFGAKMLGRGAGAMRKAVRPAMQAAKPASGMGPVQQLSRGNRMKQWGAQQMGQAAGGLQRAATAVRANPLSTLGKGAIEAGKGAMFMGGKGIGGAVGKGMFGAQAASMFMPGGDRPQMPAPYGQYPQQRNGG